MNTVVLDASVALRAVFPHEPGHEAVLEMMVELAEAGIEPVAPDLLPYEIGQAVRRRRESPLERTRVMLDAMQLARIQQPSIDAFARAQSSPANLSFYDGTYVALAEEIGSILWTEDSGILRAAPNVSANTANLRQRLRF